MNCDDFDRLRRLLEEYPKLLEEAIDRILDPLHRAICRQHVLLGVSLELILRAICGDQPSWEERRWWYIIVTEALESLLWNLEKLLNKTS